MALPGPVAPDSLTVTEVPWRKPRVLLESVDYWPMVNINPGDNRG